MKRARQPAASAWIGTSGFTYKHWKSIFYPDDVPQRRWLEFYAQHFNTVELNNTFYRMPRLELCRTWGQRVPDGFLIVLKLNRILTHLKRFVDVERLLGDFLAAADEIGRPKLGPILVQLPPTWRRDSERLSDFLDLCPTRYRWAVEFRESSWLTEEVYHLLRLHNAALVIHDNLPQHPRELTADWTYLRFHGGGGGQFPGHYPPDYLHEQARFIHETMHGGRDVYAYFNNDCDGWAIRDARTLINSMQELSAGGAKAA